MYINHTSLVVISFSYLRVMYKSFIDELSSWIGNESVKGCQISYGADRVESG